MFKKIITAATRHIRKHPGYSILNILGLTLGISSALFLIIYVAYELSYDRYNENADRIYRVSAIMTQQDAMFRFNRTMVPLGPQAVHDYPEIESFVRLQEMDRAVYKYEDQKYLEKNFFYADSTVFDMFTYKVIKGDVKSALSKPNKIVLTEKIAARYFGTTDPVGKTLTTGSVAYEVAGVIQDIPLNSHIHFDALTSWNNLPGDYGAWSGISVFTYLLFPSNSDVKAVEKKMQAMFDTYIRPIVPPESNLRVEFVLEPLIRIHLYSTTPDEPEPTGSISFVYIFSLVALFLVLISSINYINLATARSSRRANEVSIRKVVGSGRGQLIVQFLSESVVLTLVSLVLSIIIVIIFLPDFNMLCSKSFDLHVIFSRAILLVLFGIMLMVSILGGSFPAFVLSGFTPVSVLKSDATLSLPGGLLRKILVVFQFAVSVLMIICTLVISRQLKFLQTMDRGFDENNVIALQLNGLMNQKYPVLKQYLLENPDIKYVTSTDSPVGSGSGKSYFNVETDQGMSQKIINCAVVDYDFIKTLGIKIIKGRDFQQDMLSDTLAGVIVNETFVNQMGWSEPIGKKVETGNFNGISARVIGVMHDYHQAGMYNETGSFILINRIRNSIVYLKLRGNNVQETLDYINKRWTEVFPGETFTYTFLTDRFNMQFEADERRGHIFSLFTLLAIIIACLGLFGLVSYTVEQRTKEIGIRKVFGAHEGSILKLILKDFLLLVSIGIIIAVPVAYYLMSQWLQKYVYRTGIGMAVIATSALLTVLITFFTIIYKAYMASVINPADSIRTE